MSSVDVFWIVKLPAEWKEVFEKAAENDGDDTRGAGARHLRKFLRRKIPEVEGIA